MVMTMALFLLALLVVYSGKPAFILIVLLSLLFVLEVFALIVVRSYVLAFLADTVLSTFYSIEKARTIFFQTFGFPAWTASQVNSNLGNPAILFLHFQSLIVLFGLIFFFLAFCLLIAFGGIFAPLTITLFPAWSVVDEAFAGIFQAFTIFTEASLAFI